MPTWLVTWLISTSLASLSCIDASFIIWALCPANAMVVFDRFGGDSSLPGVAIGSGVCGIMLDGLEMPMP